jgi:hypothetical protein
MNPMVKRLKDNKRIFLVEIEESYWQIVYQFCSLSKEQQQEIKEAVYNDIDKQLLSAKNPVVIFVPKKGRSLITIKQITGKKRARIIIKSSKQ